MHYFSTFFLCLLLVTQFHWIVVVLEEETKKGKCISNYRLTYYNFSPITLAICLCLKVQIQSHCNIIFGSFHYFRFVTKQFFTLRKWWSNDDFALGTRYNEIERERKKKKIERQNPMMIVRGVVLQIKYFLMWNNSIILLHDTQLVSSLTWREFSHFLQLSLNREQRTEKKKIRKSSVEGGNRNFSSICFHITHERLVVKWNNLWLYFIVGRLSWDLCKKPHKWSVNIYKENK